MRSFRLFFAWLLALPLWLTAATPQSKLAAIGPDGRLHYQPWNKLGDQLPDFSHCGYGGGGVPLPVATVRVTLEPKPEGDDSARIQQAIDQVAALPLGADGLRGAVLLKRGAYRCATPLRFTTSGVVLRGEGEGAGGTVITAMGKKAEALVKIGGAEGPKAGKAIVEITDNYVPIGATCFTVKEASGLRVGQTVYVIRRGNAAWISEMAMDRITPRASNPSSTKQWPPFDLKFDRVIIAIKENRVEIDAPIGCAIDQRWGGGAVQPYGDAGRIEHCGIESLSAVSVFDKSKTDTQDGEKVFTDEEHATWLVDFGAVKTPGRVTSRRRTSRMASRFSKRRRSGLRSKTVR